VIPCVVTCFHLKDVKEAQIREHLRKVEGLEEICVDYEGTIQQFRELVLQLQTFVLFCNHSLDIANLVTMSHFDFQ